MKHTQLVIEHTWEGEALTTDEIVTVDMSLSSGSLNVGIDAPFHNDPAPDVAAGSLEGLWEFEVVEVFLGGSEGRYLELEFGPFGHFLVLSFAGYREALRRGLPVEYGAQRAGKRWTGQGRLDAGLLPTGLRSCNAFAMHGGGAERRYLALQAAPGQAPDFHRLDTYRPLDW